MLCIRLSRSSSLIYQLRDYLPIHVLKKIYYAHVLPHINYCNFIWSHTFQTHLSPHILIHKRTIRNISKADYCAHTEPLYQNLRILNIENIRKLNLALLMLKNRQTNEYNIPMLTPHHHYHTRHREQLLIPLHRTTLHSNSFCIQAVRFWNQIPLEIKDSRTFNTFKQLNMISCKHAGFR